MFATRNANRSLISLAATIGVLVGLSFAARCEAARYNEAPMLRKLVEEGKLPPVEERLPEEPMVVNPYARIGVGFQSGTFTNMPSSMGFSTGNINLLNNLTFDSLFCALYSSFGTFYINIR